MRFLFVGPALCLRLPSDSASRRTPRTHGQASREAAHQPLALLGIRL